MAPLFAFPEQAVRRLPTVPTTVGRAALTLLVALVAAGCSPQGPKVAVGKHASTRSCHYEVQIVDPDEAELEVEARCDGSKLSAFIASESVMAALVDDARHQDGRPLKRRDDTFVLPPGADAHIRYRVNLDKVADLTQDIDVAYRVGKSWMSPVSTWALRPDPVPGHATVTIRVHTPEGFDFEAAVHRSGDLYHLESQELRTATYAVFGRFHRDAITLPGPLALDGGRRAFDEARLDVLTLDGAFNASEDERRGWIEESANAVAEFFHGFPVQRAALMVVPVPDHLGVLHGKVVPAGGAGIALLMGEHTPRYRLYRDWILVHELFHLGFPSFWKEGKWLDEGLATYYEPIIRARAGWRSENSVWREFAHEMPQAVPALELGGLENTSDHGAIYWGGALLSLMADAETRRKSGGKLGLEDGVRGLIAAGADATQVWDLEHAIRIIDAQLGDSTLQQLASDHAVDGSPLDFDRTLHRLGVHRTDHGVILADDAPLSTVRRSMIRSQ